jgi:hypothetical protein
MENKLKTAMKSYTQHMLRYTLCPLWHWMGLFNKSWHAFCVLSDLWWVRSTHIEMNSVPRGHCMKGRCILSLCWLGEGLVNTGDSFCVLVGTGGVWSTQVEIHFDTSLAWNGFVKHKLRHILSLRWHGMGLVNACWDAFNV